MVPNSTPFRILGIAFLGIVATAAHAQAQLVRNGTFESGSANWSATTILDGRPGSTGIVVGGPCPHLGANYAYLGDLAGTANAKGSVHQTSIDLPASATSIVLQFYLNVQSAEGTSTAFDLLDVNLRRSSNDSLLERLRGYSNQNKVPSCTAYSLQTIDITHQRGQRVTLQFYVDTDSNLETIFRIDDVSIATVQTCTDSQCAPCERCQNNSCVPVSCSGCNVCNSNHGCTSYECCSNSDCNDNLTCTTDSCSGGSCQYAIVANKCRIANACYSNGDANPANACQRCSSSTSQTSWSNRTNGTLCDDGQYCTTGEACQNGSCGGGSPRSCSTGETCNESTNTCGCTSSAQCNNNRFCDGVETCQGGNCVSPGNPCPPGQTCNESTDTCGCTSSAQCNNNQFCDGAETCQSGNCIAGERPCDDDNGLGCSPGGAGTEVSVYRQLR